MIFVGERPSPKAHATGATWSNGKLAAKTLHEALRSAGIDPHEHVFINLWRKPGLGKPAEGACRKALRAIHEAHRNGSRVVAMGNLVQRELSRHGIPFTPLVHPAARGSIRRRDTYQQHVRQALGGAA